MKFFDNLKDGFKKAVNFSDEDDFDDDENYGDDDFDDEDDYYKEEEPVKEPKKTASSFKSKAPSSTPSAYNPPEYSSESRKFSSSESSSSYGFKSAPKAAANLYKMDAKPQPKKLKVTLFVLEDMDDARNVADCMIERGVVTLADMTKLPTESVRRVLDFLDGVKYVCKSKIEVIAEKIYLIVPEAAELSGDFFGQVDKPSFF